jgi:nucleoside-diphosphate-sugar epimerase
MKKLEVMGERQLLTLFKQAILQNPEELTIIGDGKNSIPMIHISDLSQVIEEIVFSKP